MSETRNPGRIGACRERLLAAAIAAAVLVAVPALAAPASRINAVAPAAPAVLVAQAAPAAAAASPLPNGATSLQETYQDWQVSCGEQAGAKHCALSQQQADPQSHQRVLGIELDPTASAATVQGLLILPFGLALNQGVTMQVDDGAASAPLPFRTCLPGGCLVALNLDAKMIGTLRKGTALKLKAIADSGQAASLSVSLKGFGGALDRTIALVQ